MSIKKINQISTKNGDKGESRDYSNRLYKKNDIIFEAMGTIDELSSNLGLAYHYCKSSDIIEIQKILEGINAVIATDNNDKKMLKNKHLDLKQVIELEKKMQDLLDNKALEPRFLLPGSEKSLAGAYIDVCRAVCRRTERRMVDFINISERSDLGIALMYLNRLSDYLFVLSCNL